MTARTNRPMQYDELLQFLAERERALATHDVHQVVAFGRKWSGRVPCNVDIQVSLWKQSDAAHLRQLSGNPGAG